MRFNDLIATVLAGRSEGARARGIMWRQCVDLLAQFDNGNTNDDADLDRVAAMLEALRPEVDVSHKLGGLQELGSRLTSPRLVRLLLGDTVAIQAAVMRQARLPDGAWPEIIAVAGPLARSILRRRTDLGKDAQRALDAFGLSDMSLIDMSTPRRAAPEMRLVEPIVAAESAVVPEKGGTHDKDQIRRIVDRIERFTSERHERNGREPHVVATPTSASVEPVAGPVERFTFLTDADGVVATVHGVPRAVLAGLRLATASLDRSTGPDGQILGAFRRRGAFRDGRLTLGEGLLAGCWLVDGDPLFDRRTGRFTGYRGAARRASDQDMAPIVTGHAAVAQAMSPEEANPASAATSLRQLIHELRTPLTGVMGFAELIESQLLGPVSDPYRNMAGEIVGEVRSLVDILDDLDLANRTDVRHRPTGQVGADIAALLSDAAARLGMDGAGRGRIGLESGPTLPHVDVAPMMAERMVMHLVRALIGCVGDEVLAARYRCEDAHVVVQIDRPIAMAALSEAQLFDSGCEHVAVNMEAPVLGVGFALRLVQRLALANGGALTVQADHFLLSFPILGGVADAKDMLP